MSKNINQIYISNPSSTVGDDDLFYIGKFPYGLTNDSAIIFSDLLTNIFSVNRTQSFQAFGLGQRSQITLTDSDFVGGMYALSNPCPNFIKLNCSSSGNTLQLPSAQGSDAFELFTGPEIINGGTQRVNIVSFLGIPQTPSLPGADAVYILTDNSTTGGLWDARGHIDNVNGQTGSVVLAGPLTEVFVCSANGIDMPGRGDILSPYATPDFAMSQITTASQSNPFVIKCSGSFTSTNIALKPWVAMDFQQGSFTVTGSVTLHSSWSGGGIFSLQNCSSLSWPATVTLNFSALLPSSTPVFSMINNNTNSVTTLNINGATVFISNDFGLSSEFSYGITNCFGAITNGASGNITITHSSETFGGNFSVNGMTVIGNLFVNSSTTANFLFFNESSKIFGTTLYQATGPGNTTVQAKSMSYSSAPTLDNGSGGGSVIFTIDFLQSLPTLLNGATYTPTSIADAMSANYPTPVNFTYPVGEENTVKGAIAALDIAVGNDGDNPSLNDVYNNPPNATVQLVANRPISIQEVTSSVGAEGVTTPSTGSDTVANNRVLAMFVTPVVNMTIATLQYDDSLFTEPGTRETGIYVASTQELLTSVFISKTDPLVGGYRTHTLPTPLPVDAGVQLCFATVMAANETNHLNADAVPNASITIDGYGTGPASSLPVPLQFPQTITMTPNVVLVGSFTFDATTIDESVNTYDSTTNPQLITETKSTVRAAVIEPVMTLAELTAIGLTTKGAAAFVSDSTPPRPYRFDGTILQGMAYLSDVPAPLPTLTKGQVVGGGTGGTPTAINITSLGGTVNVSLGISGQIDLEAQQNLQQAYDEGQTIVLNSGTTTLTITDNLGANTLYFNSDGTNPFFQMALTTSYSIPYGVYSDATFSGMSLQQGAIAYITTSNRLSVFDGMGIQKLAQLSDFISGTFTPGISNVANTSALTFIKGMYTTCGFQSGNIVTCTLQFSCSVTLPGLSTVRFSSLPLPPGNFVDIKQACLMGGAIYTNGSPTIADGSLVDITSNTGATTLDFSFLIASTAGPTKIISVSFMYVIQ